jgi:hypothetical protein
MIDKILDICNHSSGINKNKIIIKVKIEIVIERELDNDILDDLK